MIAAYPLQWPAGWPRTQIDDHKPGKFGTRKADLAGSDLVSYRSAGA